MNKMENGKLVRVGQNDLKTKKGILQKVLEFFSSDFEKGRVQEKFEEIKHTKITKHNLEKVLKEEGSRRQDKIDKSSKKWGDFTQ